MTYSYKDVLLSSDIFKDDIKILPEKLGKHNVKLISELRFPYFQCSHKLASSSYELFLKFKIYYSVGINNNTYFVEPVIVPIVPSIMELQELFPELGLVSKTYHTIGVTGIDFSRRDKIYYKSTFDILKHFFNSFYMSLLKRAVKHDFKCRIDSQFNNNSVSNANNPLSSLFFPQNKSEINDEKLSPQRRFNPPPPVSKTTQIFETELLVENQAKNSQDNVSDSFIKTDYQAEDKFHMAMHYGITRVRKEEVSGDCRLVVLSDRAWRSIIAETSEYGNNETGGLMLGNFDSGIWYVVDCLDGGFNTTNSRNLFKYQADYVNHLFKKVSRIYRYPLTIEGIWHRHPGSMDYFSNTDYESLSSLVDDSNFGMIFMLVNVDPEMRMTFFYVDKKKRLFSVPFIVGDKYIIKEFMEFAEPSFLSYNGSSPIKLAKINDVEDDLLPLTLEELRNTFKNNE